jgi:rhodanese-related sulfurtransferase
MRRFATFAVAAVLATGLASAQSGDAPLESARRIEQKEAVNLVKKHKAVFVDVRPKDAYEQGHIKGAMNIPLGEVLQRLNDLPRGKMIITYCA